jgi:hypothetical protein
MDDMIQMDTGTFHALCEAANVSKCRDPQVVLSGIRGLRTKLDLAKRHFWGAILDLWDDDEADELVSRLMKRVERRHK